MFSLDQARSFIAVATELHFGRAAESLHMTQPPLSRQIQKLEASLGVTLLIRHNRGVSLTAAGEAFLTECENLITRAEQAPDRVRQVAAGRLGSINLGYTASSAYQVLGKLLSILESRLPNVTVHLHELVTAQQLNGLERGTIDLGIARPTGYPDGISHRRLLTETLMAAIPSSHPLASRDSITAADLQGEKMIMHSADHARYFHDLTREFIDPSSTITTHTATQTLTIAALVAAGHGIALLPHSTTELKLSGVTYLPLVQKTPTLVELHALWLTEHTNPCLSAFLRILKEEDLNLDTAHH